MGLAEKGIKLAARIAWGITGAGHFLKEVAQLLAPIPDVDLFVSRSGEEVVKMYGLEGVFLGASRKIFYDRAASAPAITKLYLGYYRLAVVAPATSNSVAKFVNGISDGLVSNLFAYAGKAKVPILVLPTDVAPAVSSAAPGRMIQVYPRLVDLENVKRLEAFAGVSVVKDVESLKLCLNTYL